MGGLSATRGGSPVVCAFVELKVCWAPKGPNSLPALSCFCFVVPGRTTPMAITRQPKNNSDNDKSNTNDHKKQQRQQQTQQQQPQKTTTATTTRAITTRRTAASAATAMVTTSATTAPATATTTTDNSKHNEMATSKSICQMFRFLNVVISGISHNLKKSIFPSCPEKSFDNLGVRNF